MAKVTAVTTVFPYTGLLRFLLSPKAQVLSYKQTIFPTENARWLSKSAVIAPVDVRSRRWWVVFRVVTETLTDCRALCARGTETPPPGVQGGLSPHPKRRIPAPESRPAGALSVWVRDAPPPPPQQLWAMGQTLRCHASNYSPLHTNWHICLALVVKPPTPHP